MMFLADSAIAFELIALVAGTALLLWVKRMEGCGRLFGMIVGYFVIIISLLGMLCTVYYTVQYRQAGYFRAPLKFQCGGMGGGGREEKGMNCPMMEHMGGDDK
jgi:hypothetical protein